MKKHSFYTFLIAIVIALAIGGGVWYANREIIVPVDLTPGLRQEYETKLKDFTEKLKQPDPNDELKRPNLDYFTEKARYEQYLGFFSEAERTLKQGLSFYPSTSVYYHNLARLYEQMGRPRKAIAYYYKLINEVAMENYYMDIATLARNIGDKRLASDSYWEFQKWFKEPDGEFEEWLRANGVFH